MAQGDRERWDARYASRGVPVGGASTGLADLERFLPTQGRALDVAGGDGRNAVWLAGRGLDVTLVDVSPVALRRAEELARSEGVELATAACDLETQPLPEGPWGLVVCVDYVQRDLWATVVEQLAPAGRIVWVHPTVTNLERNPKPSRRFLLDPGEAEAIVRALPLNVVHAEEGWVGGRHLSRVVGEK